MQCGFCVLHNNQCGWANLFDVEDDEELDGADGRQQGAVEGADPADGLAVDDLQHVLGDGELLLPPPLGQAAGTVVIDDPEASQGQNH